MTTITITMPDVDSDTSDNVLRTIAGMLAGNEALTVPLRAANVGIIEVASNTPADEPGRLRSAFHVVPSDGWGGSVQMRDRQRPLTLNRAPTHGVTDEYGTTFRPWSDGYSVGFMVTHGDGTRRFSYLTPGTPGFSEEGREQSFVTLHEGSVGDSLADRSITRMAVRDVPALDPTALVGS